MRLPTPLLRLSSKSYKNAHGHVLILAGSPRMLGAAALTTLAAMRSGAGLVTLGIPKSLNLTAQRKIAHSVMTLPLKETRQSTFSPSAFTEIMAVIHQYQAVAIGPGISRNIHTEKFIFKCIESIKLPLIIDADGLNAVAQRPQCLLKTSSPKILTPHPGEMARLISIKKADIEDQRTSIALDFAKKYRCVLLLKGHHTVVASDTGQCYINKTGNSGMATGGSGDVLTGMITAFVGQGLSAFEAAKWGTMLHGLAGDIAAKKVSRTALIATDLINHIPAAFKMAA